MRLYLCGPITGTVDYRERFARAQEALEVRGFDVVNPVTENGSDSQEPGTPDDPGSPRRRRIMARCLNRILDEDEPIHALFLMREWADSRGCKAEKALAEYLGLPVMTNPVVDDLADAIHGDDDGDYG